MRRLAMAGRGVSAPSCAALLVFLVGLGAPFLSPPALGQAVYGSIAGTVTDNSGAVLPGVAVTITSVQRKTVDTVVTDENGRYTRERLLPGAYEVRAELQGFKLAVVPEVTVAVDTQTPVNFTMEVGQVAEEVTVTGGSPLLKTDRADVSTRFEQRQLTELPVLDRNATKFLLLTPGTQQLGWQHAASENPQGSVQIQVNGQHFSGTGYQLDGTENRDPILGIIVINPTLESLGEMKVTSQNYDAEFGQATAGVVSMQTKSGTNSYPRQRLRVLPGRRLPVPQPVHAIPGRPRDRQVHPRHDQAPVRRINRRPHPDEPVLLLHRLPGTARHPGWLAAADGAHRGRASRRPERVRDSDLRPANGHPGYRRRPAAVCRRPDSGSQVVAAGAGDPRPHSAAQRARPRERHTRQLHRLGLRDVSRSCLQRPRRWPADRLAQHVRPLQSR